jgi:hypothetical protein
MGAFSFAWTASGIPERILSHFGNSPPSSGSDAGPQERQQYCLFMLIMTQHFYYQAH